MLDTSLTEPRAMNPLDAVTSFPAQDGQQTELPCGPWRARSLGSAAADIDIAIDLGNRAMTVTSLLAACMSDAQGHPLDIEQVWNWTLNQRLQALIAMRLAAGNPVLALQSSCTRCDEAMETALDLRMLVAEPVSPRFIWRDGEGMELMLRLPTGRDLEIWMKDGIPLHGQLLMSLIESAADRPLELSTLMALEPKIDDALQAHDPLTALQLQTSCPACGHENAIACDLEVHLLEGFARDQAGTLDDVIQLAGAFRWSESEILALPRWRRTHYLRQLQRQQETGAWA